MGRQARDRRAHSSTRLRRLLGAHGDPLIGRFLTTRSWRVLRWLAERSSSPSERCDDEGSRDADKGNAMIGGAIGASHGDDGLALGMSLSDMTDGLSGLAQRVRLVDNRCDLPGLNELLQSRQVLRAVHRDERAQLLADEQ